MTTDTNTEASQVAIEARVRDGVVSATGFGADDIVIEFPDEGDGP